MNPALRQLLRRRWLRELLVLALLFKALIPTGYMADVGSDGLPTLKLCAYVVPLAGPDSSGGPAGSETGDDRNDHAMHGVCPQAPLRSPVLASPFWVAVVPSLTAVTHGRTATDSLHLYRSPTPHSRLPRGPPALV